MMLTADKYLPTNSTPTEKALADVMSADIPLPLRDIVNAATTPVGWLPPLAGHESVDLWFEDWPVTRKRLMVEMATQLAALKGTRPASAAFLAFVDGVLLDKISYPRPFIMGRSPVGRTPIGHPAFVARHLIKVETHKPARSLVVGRRIIGRAVLRTPSRERIRRCLEALKVAKVPETEFRADFAHMRQIRLSDGVPLDGTYRLGQYLDRIRL